MNTKKREIHLTQTERIRLKAMQKKGTWKAREIRNARLLLMADASQPQNMTLATACGCVVETVRKVKKKYVEEGLDRALFDNPRSGAKRRLTAEEESYIIATACTPAPDGYDHWTLELLASYFEKHKKKHIGTATVYRVELRNELKPWQKKRMGNTRSY